MEVNSVNKFIKNVKAMDTPKDSKQVPFESIYTESLSINWVISSQYSNFLYRPFDVVMGSMMQQK